MSKTILVLIALGITPLASMTAARAQTIPPPSMQPTASAIGPEGIIQITTTFQARIEGLSDARSVPTTTAQDAARRALYNMAANECTVLAEFWKADCRLGSFSIYVALADITGREVQPQIPTMFGTAVYELRLLSAPGR